MWRAQTFTGVWFRSSDHQSSLDLMTLDVFVLEAPEGASWSSVSHTDGDQFPLRHSPKLLHCLTRWLSAVVPVLHVSFISRQRSLTEEALRPRAAPMVAQSLPCFSLSLMKHK